MPGGTRRGKRPIQYALDGHWPYAVMDDLLGARVAQAVSRALAEAMERKKISANALAQASEVETGRSFLMSWPVSCGPTC